jgi:hypothetical protein
MAYYPCPKCNVIFNKKSNLTRHMNKIYDCSQKVNKNNNLEEFAEISTNLQEFAEISTNFQKLAQINFNSNNNEILLKQQNYSNILKSDFDDLIETNDNSNIDEDAFCCSFCNKKLSSKYILLRHMKDYCKVKKSIDEEKENIFKLLLEKDKKRDMEISELKKQNELFEKQNKIFEKQNKILMDKIDKLINSKTSKTINNNQKITNNNQKITNTMNNNIIMVNFGKEDLSIIDEKQFIDRVVKKPLLSGVKIPDEVLKIIHFNPEYPQLSNIYISDINREKCMVFEDGEWVLSSVDNIPQIMDKVCIFSNDQINMLKEKYPNNKPLQDRLGVIEKYNNLIDGNFLEDLKDDNVDGGNQNQISRCEEFQKYTYEIFKNTLYNEGKKLKKSIK